MCVKVQYQHTGSCVYRMCVGGKWLYYCTSAGAASHHVPVTCCEVVCCEVMCTLLCWCAELELAQKDMAAIKRQAESTAAEYDRLSSDYQKLQVYTHARTHTHTHTHTRV